MLFHHCSFWVPYEGIHVGSSEVFDDIQVDILGVPYEDIFQGM